MSCFGILHCCPSRAAYSRARPLSVCNVYLIAVLFRENNIPSYPHLYSISFSESHCKAHTYLISCFICAHDNDRTSTKGIGWPDHMAFQRPLDFALQLQGIFILILETPKVRFVEITRQIPSPSPHI